MVVRKRRTTRRKQRGGINWRSLLKRGHDYVKSNKLASRGLNALGYKKAADMASSLGYGKRKRRAPRRRVSRQLRGGNWFKKAWNKIKGVAAPVYNFVKDNKLVSKALGATGNAPAAAVAGTLGFGRRRVARRKTVIRKPAVRRLTGVRRIQGGAKVMPHVMIY